MERKEEKVLVGNIQKFSTEDGPGIRTTVFLKGCPLNCRWCHNPELISYEQQIIRMPNSCIKCGYCVEHCPEKAVYIDSDKLIQVDRTKCSTCLQCTSFCYAGGLKAVASYMTPEEIIKEAAQDKGFYDHTGGGMTISGGEMLSHPYFVERLVDLAAEQGINVCLDTSGCGDSDALMRLALKPNVTHLLYDMKSIDPEVHKACTGVDNSLILKNLRMLAADSRTLPKLQMRMPLISGLNDIPAIIDATGVLYKELGIRGVTLLPYHELGISKKRNIGGTPERFSAPSEDRIQEIKKYFEDYAGMNVEILGRA